MTPLVFCIVMILGLTRADDFNVLNFGAVGDGATDDSKAFSSAWEAACGAASGTPTLQIPEGKKFLLKPIMFKGPCKSSAVHVQLLGSIIAPSDPSAWDDRSKWLSFEHVNGLTVDGKGQVDGQGSAWWQQCGRPNSCTRPTALLFHGTNNLKVDGLTHLDSQRNHISISGSDTVVLSNLHISAPETSPNTDGIDISGSKNVQILHSTIATGDDCIAINGGSSFINITDVTCGPGHGISVGSLGKGGATETVEEVHVKGCTFKGTQNGARIKTWQGGSGSVRKISFDGITLESSGYPIVINQNYNPSVVSPRLNGIPSDDLSISEISYTGFQGTSKTLSAITFNCSQATGCTGLTLAHINISSSTGEATFATCNNAHGTYTDTVPKADCLLG